MTPDEAADLAARTRAAIDLYEVAFPSRMLHFAADRERVASELAGLRECYDPWGIEPVLRSHAARYADGLRRTAALYGVTP